MTFRLIHSVDKWLPVTQRWIWEQYRNLPFSNQIIFAEEVLPISPPASEIRVKPDESNDLLSRLSRKFRNPKPWRQAELDKIGTPVVLFSHFGNRGWSDLKLKADLHITRFYGYDLKRIIQQDGRWEERYHRLFKQCDAFIAEGNAMAARLREMGCSQKKIYVIPLGTSQPEKTIIRNYEGGKVEILIASGFTEKKGIVYALQALGELKQEGRLKNFTINLVGAERQDYLPDREYWNRMQTTIREFVLEGNTIFHGYLEFDQLRALALQCHFGMHTSVSAADGDTEGGSPVVLMDLMAGGLPFITSRHADIPEVVTDPCGILCEERDVEEIKRAVLEMLEPDVLSRKSAAAIDRMAAHFFWNDIGPKQAQLINALWAQKFGQ